MSQLSQKPVLIFADPEPAILRSARRVLHRGHADWNLHFCESLEDARMLANSDTPWILVLDESLLGADLSEAHGLFEQAPYALRVILTSSAHESVLYGSARIAHLVLPKPFQKDDLERVLQRAIAAAQLDLSAELRSCIGSLKSLPVLPEVYRHVSQELELEAPNVDRLAKIISGQPQVLARLLQISNSALFGFSTPSKDTQQLVMRLGLDMVKHLVLFSGLFSSSHSGVSEEKMTQLANESQQFSARLIALADKLGCSTAVRAECWVAGLMHNIGKLVILGCADRVQQDSQKALREYPNAGALLLILWGFPLEIARAVALQLSDSLDESEAQVVQLVYAAQLLARPEFELGMLDRIEDVDLQNACKASVQNS